MNYGETDGRALLDRMTGAAEKKEYTFSDADIDVMLNLMFKNFFTTSEGAKGLGMTCDITRVVGGWDVKLRKPEGRA